MSWFHTIPSGEQFQELCEAWIGCEEDFGYNPRFAGQFRKRVYVDKIEDGWNNPALLFCYSRNVHQLSTKLGCLTRPCVIVFGNSDENLTFEKCRDYLECDLVIRIFCQNIGFEHPRASWIPIGIANTMWSHGNPAPIVKLIESEKIEKSASVFCAFRSHTNVGVRADAAEACRREGISNCIIGKFENYIEELAKFKFCICPEGNGFDTHRFWEAVWLQCVPIVVRCPMTEQIQRSGIPCVLIESWAKFKLGDLPAYEEFKFNYDRLNFSWFSNSILEAAACAERMSVILSFIGVMPNYVVDCIGQLRSVYSGPCYLIYSSVSDTIRASLKQYLVELIPYETVRSERFNRIRDQKGFYEVGVLGDRRKLLETSYERLYLVAELMKQRSLRDVWTMEIDILMFRNPEMFLPLFRRWPYMYSYHNHELYSAAIMYIRSVEDFEPVLETLDTFRGSYTSEMSALFDHRQRHPGDGIFPQLIPCEEDKDIWHEFGQFSNFIFDGAVIGQFTCGIDPCITGGQVVLEASDKLYTQPNFWKYGRVEFTGGKPMLVLFDGRGRIPIVNLHVHSKELSQWRSG